MNSKNTLRFFIPFIFLILLNSCSDSENEDDSSSICKKRTCSSFSKRREAQIAFDSNPECYKSLDRDNDGVACETESN